MHDDSRVPTRIHVERSVFEQFVDHTLYHSENEWGGLLVGKEIKGELKVLAAILPPQKKQTPGYCEFGRELLIIMMNAFDAIEEKFKDEDFQIVSWVHTHPDLGVFLSGTDHETFGRLSKQSKSISAVVIDPVQYEWLAVNSNPGNSYGYTNIDMNLNFLHDFGNENQILIEKLELLRESINSPKSRRIFKLDETDKIEVFIPIPLEELKEKLIISNLTSFMKQIKETSKVLFEKEAEIQVRPTIEEDSKIKRLLESQSYFRAMFKELKSWKRVSFNRLLYAFDLNKLSSYNPAYNGDYIDDLKEELWSYAQLFEIPAIFKINIRDKTLNLSNDEEKFLEKWSSIKKIQFFPISKSHPFYVVSFKGGFFSKTKSYLIIVPDINQFVSILNMKADIKQEQDMKLIIRFKENRQKQREKLDEIMKKEEAKEKALEEDTVDVEVKDRNEEKSKNDKDIADGDK